MLRRDTFAGTSRFEEPFGSSLGASWPAGSAVQTPRGQFLAQHAQDLVFELENEGRFRFISPNCASLLGYTPAELFGQSALETLHPDDGAPFCAAWQAPADNLKFRLRHHAGHFLPFEAALIPLDDGVLVIGRDISHRECLEGELAALLAIAGELNSDSGLDKLLERVSTRLKVFLPFDLLFITFVEGQSPESQVLRQVAPDPDYVPLFAPLHRAEFPDHPVWNLMGLGSTWIEKDSWAHFPEQSSQRGQGRSQGRIRAFINVPLVLQGGALGVLHLDAYEPQNWNEHQLRVARLVGEQLASVVQGAYLGRQRRVQEEELAQSNALLRATQEAAAEGICLVNMDGKLASYNRRFAHMWNFEGEAEANLLAENRVMAHVLAQIADPDEFINKIVELFDAIDDNARDEIELLDGRTLERYSAPAIADDGRSFGRVWAFSDITARRQSEAQLAHQAWHDAVTGLPNRILFGDHLRRALAKLDRTPRQLAVLFLDLDRFKIVNDSLGHEKGDQLLIQVADRIRQSLRPGDVAARFGGDEFMVLLEEVASVGDATRVADRIAANLQTPFSLQGHEVNVTTSIGIVLSGSSRDLADDLLRKADIAMYGAKHNGKAQYEVFSEHVSGETLERLQWELDLTAALKREELAVFYQPIIELEVGQVRSFEALVRWNHPTRGLILPDQFLSMAEETGQILGIGSFVLGQACAQAKAWSDLCGEPITMHVNLSVRQFEQADLEAEIARTLAQTGLPAAQLMVEITESALVSDSSAAMRQLERLRKLGVRVAIDDFGTGYSSLSYLETFSIDLLKIDRAFVARMAQGTTIVRAVASLGRALGLEVAAEGIETTGQRSALREIGIQWGQGHLFSHSIAASEAEKLLQTSFSA